MDEIPANNYQYEQQVKVTLPKLEVNTVLSQYDFTQVNLLFKQGKTSMTNGNYQQAIAALDQGIQKLDSYYMSTSLKDDTRMKLILANAEQQKGNLERAAHLKHNILESCIHLYNELHSNTKD